jgi:ATP-binding cassette subfamily F protein uup
MTILFSIQHLSLQFPHKLIFSDVSFNFLKGEKVGLIGLNGHGKSSLLKIITEELVPDQSTPPFVFDKSKDFSFFYIPQELKFTPSDRIEDYFYQFYPEIRLVKNRLDMVNLELSSLNENSDQLLKEQNDLIEKLSRLGEERIHSQYLSYLKTFGVTDTSRLMSSLSGGEQRKIALSLGLSAPQELLLWDEPTNHLDLETIEIYEEELQNSKKSIIIISHDRSLLNNIVDKILHIQRGSLRAFEGSYEEYLSFLKDEELRKEKELDRLTNLNRRETAWIRRGVQARRTKSKKRIDDYQTLQNKIQDIRGAAHKSVSLSIQSSGRKTKQLILAEKLGHKFGEHQLFEGLNFSIHKGDKIALLGANGVGKSTLLKILLNELDPTAGQIHRAHNLDIGYFSQKREALQDHQTPWGLIGEGIDYVISNTGEKKHVASYLENFLFSSEELKRPIHTFSGGEKNRLQLAQFMKHARDIWIFDEPTNDLDLETIGILEEELKNYEGALIIVGHDRTFIQNISDKCWILSKNGVEIFEAGFRQASEYLELMKLENEIKNNQIENSESLKKTNVPQKPKLSNKDKLRFEQIGPEIEKFEMDIKALQQSLILQYDSTTAQKIMDFEKKIEELYEEWANLESKLI